MASILRSSKFARYVVGFARNVVVNTPREFDGNFVNASQCLCGAVTTPFSSQATLHHEQNLEKSLKRIDQDVRKSGRISKRDIEDVLEEIRSNRSATTSQSLLVIRCCGNLVPEELPEVRTKLVKEIWNTLHKLNVPMDVSHYNALLRVYIENEYEFSPVDFLSEMKEKNIEPNRVTYQRLIMQYCLKGDIEGATNILEHMKQQQLPVNENVFNALIVGHSNLNDMESAQDVLNLMVQAGLEPSADTYTSLLCGYAKQGDIETMKKILEECEAKDIFLLDKDFLEIASALAINGHDEHLPVILGKMRKAVGYNQDAVNTVLNLVNKAREKPAYEILKTMNRNYNKDGSPVNSGVFFIKQLIKMRRPVKSIIELCDKMDLDGLMSKPLLFALETAIEKGNEQIAYPLMEELRKRGQEIRPHFFWPLIRIRSKDDGNEGVLQVLSKMKSMGVPLSNETIKDFVIPSLKGSFSDIIKILTQSDISVGSSALNIAISLLRQDRIQEVSWLMTRVPAYYNPEAMARCLSQAFYKTKDLDSYMTIIREIYENLDRRVNFVRGEHEKFLSKAEVVGNLVADLMFSKTNFPLVIEDVLTRLKEQGLSISTSAAEKIQESLGDKVNDQISALLGTLTSGELTPTSLSRKPPVYIPSHQMNMAQLEKLIENCSTKNMDVRGLKRQLFSLYYRARELEKTETLMEDLKKTPDFFYSPGIYAQLMDLYAYHDKFEKATEYLEKLKEMEKDVCLSDTKILRYAFLLYKNDRFEEALKFMEETNRDRTSGEEEKNFVYISLAWRFMNSVAEKGRVEDLEKLFNLLVSKEYVAVNNVLLGPLIKVHLVNNDLDKALAKFEEMVNLYKATPWKNELACRLIQAEDAEKLQKLTDLSTMVHGEINSLYDLVFSFIECGRIRQARRILETPGLQNRPHRLNTACERYRQEGMVKPLEHLKDATKDLNHIDRSEIYYQLLLSYIKEDDTDKAMGLWTQMQEENLPPSDQFLITLSKHLQEKGMEVPFIVPEEKKVMIVKPEEPPKKTPIHIFRSFLKSDKYLEAFEYRRNVNNQWNNMESAELLEKLVQNNELDKAFTLTMELINKNNPPISRVFKFAMNRLALAGKVDEIRAIGAKIDMDMKKVLSYDNRLCHATVVAGKAIEYLEHLDREIDSANTDEELKYVSEKFPRGGAYGILEHHPELLEQYESVTKKYAAKGILAPVNILWTHYFTKGNYEKAKELWDNYLTGASRIMFQRVVQVARNTHNEEVVRNLIVHLKTSNITEGALGNVYSCLLDIKYAKGPANEVVETFEEALKDVSVDSMNRTAILRVKSCYDEIGKPFNHKVPPKNKNQNTSSSSSSSEVETK
ncbi:leucine-rich PPR motif-containing protein, mitochondrial [Coccinella septempunctata]|uniref:leucine-rich PPR motif-containing protein, mitochondrial n=1 Tax=Coccinella septempunctata TaxID=41139 RepID=UPI001D0956CA|nr:leucine-rich PPR motif-containing protein, mitochondrial [Coccinella septempunctata]